MYLCGKNNNMSIWEEIEKLIQTYETLGIGQQVDYDKFNRTVWEEYQDADGVWLNHEVDKVYNPASISLRIGIEW